jgi:hypothetical protein
VKVSSTAASPVKRTRAATSREQALGQLIAAAERLVEQGERAFFEIPSGRRTTEAGSARPTMYAPDHALARRVARSGSWHAIFHGLEDRAT